jgi:hypothetical protein
MAALDDDVLPFDVSQFAQTGLERLSEADDEAGSPHWITSRAHGVGSARSSALTMAFVGICCPGLPASPKILGSGEPGVKAPHALTR